MKSITYYKNLLTEEIDEKLSKKQMDIADEAEPFDKITGADFKALQAKKKKGVEEHHNDPNFPGGPAIHDMLDRVAADWGEDSDLYNDLEDAIVGWSDRHGNLTPKGKIAIKALLSNWDVLEDYGWLLEPKPADHTGETTSMEEGGYMGTQYDSSEDMAVDMVKKGIREEDHEVSMAQNSLKSIVSSASQLMNLLGDGEKDIPAWIQDHITNAENYINQASKNYHEYSSESDMDELPVGSEEEPVSAMSLQSMMEDLLEAKKKPSAGLSKKKKSAIVKQAKKGKDFGKKGPGFQAIVKKAKAAGAKDPEAVAGAAFWKSQAKKGK